MSLSGELHTISVHDVKARGQTNSFKIGPHAVAGRHHHARPPVCGAACACPATSRSPTATRCLRLWPRVARRSPILHQEPTAGRRWRACAAWASRSTKAVNGTVTILGRGFGQLRSPSAALDCGNSGTTMRLMAGVLARLPVFDHPDRRRVAVAAPDAACDRAARAHGRAHRIDRRPRAADGPRRAAARDCPLSDDAQRAGQERRAARRPARGRRHQCHRACGHARPHRAGRSRRSAAPSPSLGSRCRSPAVSAFRAAR